MFGENAPQVRAVQHGKILFDHHQVDGQFLGNVFAEFARAPLQVGKIQNRHLLLAVLLDDGRQLRRQIGKLLIYLRSLRRCGATQNQDDEWLHSS
ncbi:MAG: hypothetical protein A3C79_01160 [Candidatus Taylorbacteria bacterium RIFCSPHIGHO2_02_FULL_45_28]|uniref:Uncharacterized protein n=1 Tax=Candidatus Taylorbacteria bacterium RIFCSPHIGHO2_12_FULL_45_16 TaxID=1802315 RepID=A0A1G2MZM9_9BACT|nr:MAG: hypothetical protein A2830_02415 [Candidatus Taylorbacteria bacterium RIFCSPHIGHO2_01_FULL_44_110]OHA25628.1 MAG: hypothetical protein A3C79_01160 [Candidatus Taylorbacteria bacterium RIFCSPHIGHO2_02_FULL_45_28]OHA29294.1 MAG: hypothetical protein A3F51_01625 [Candidatus Taylorbacteria bacterium RIFCSPHIGHO2_12_FULL_45_16]OHA33516.1 MAG: hypothetical protein A3A23_02505 [Candidatus Taylorbacteria bacterium RIFCSPLOWO2_01_FULL_45_59]OHA39140.1 MAG: hypothetical protein A3I98_00855 [Candi